MTCAPGLKVKPITAGIAEAHGQKQRPTIRYHLRLVRHCEAYNIGDKFWTYCIDYEI